MQHIIKKQVIELDLDTRLDSFQTQESVSRRFWNSIVPLLQKTFDAVATEEEILTVDRLVIDMGVLTDKGLLKDEWIIDLNKRLEKLIGELKSTAREGSRVTNNPLPLGIFRQWLFYMQNGYLHWNTLKADDEWLTQVLDAMENNPVYASELLNLMRNDSSMVYRIIAQYPDAFLVKLLQILNRQDQGVLKTVFEVLNGLPGKQSEDAGLGKDTLRELRKSLWMKVLLGTSEGTGDSRSLARSGVSEFLKSSNLPTAILEKLDGIIPVSQTLPLNPGKEQPGPAGEHPVQLSKKTSAGLREEGIFAVNAGLVLLHPFIHNYFKRLHIVKDNAFIDKMLWQKALYLLHYLATGNTGAAEYELVIPRVLCAYPEEETVERDIPVSNAELKEADSLLTAAISQWEILKNTSIGGLREGFLQRGGKLFVKDDNLYLQVETSGIDVLLDRLPWSLGMIKLPWMERILKVEWR
jgi:hypothetical protein